MVRFWWGKGWKIIGIVELSKGTRISRVWDETKENNWNLGCRE